MAYLYVNEQGANIGIKGGRFEVRRKDELIRSIPIETMEVIQVFGNVNVSTPCITHCLKKGISIIYYSSNGSYYGRLSSTSHVNVERQRAQAAIGSNHQFCLGLSQRIIEAKIRNQIVLLRRYARHQTHEIDQTIQKMKNMILHLHSCKTISQLMGYEGAAARAYFHELGNLIVPEFSFQTRSRRPPKDAFNSMISLGYSIVMNEIVGKLEGKGLNAYFGFLHSDREKHPTLASDLMEEWRAVIVDSVAMSLANGHEISPEQFYVGDDEGVFLTPEGFKCFIRKLENKFVTESRYVSEVDYGMNFRRAMDHQICSYIRALEHEDPELYKPVLIR